MPVKVPAGASSRSPVMPREVMVFMHWSQRTGFVTWLTMRDR